jgi:hypothetical protein
MANLIVEIDPSFEDGNLNTRFFKDFKYLDESELQALTTFIAHVSCNKPLIGKNKPSWLDDNLNELPYTLSYREGRYWHYHSGPSYTQSKVRALTHQLKANFNGITSPQVIHYIKKTNNIITVVGFSPEHVPFTPSDHPNKEDPLFE